MNYVQAADILYTCDDLLKESASFFLLDSLNLNYVIEQLTSLGIFHDEIEFLLSLDNFVELNDLRVSHDLQNVNLSCHAFHIGHIAYLRFLQYLDGDFLASRNVRAQFDFAESALSD